MIDSLINFTLICTNLIYESMRSNILLNKIIYNDLFFIKNRLWR